MSVWDTYGMKTEIVLAKNWIQTPKEGYDNIFDDLLTFCWKGVGYIIVCFLGRGRIFTKNMFFFDKIFTQCVAVGPHGLTSNMEGSSFRARSDPSVNKMPRTHF